MLENYGYAVLDLGRDVPPETVVQAVTEQTDLTTVGVAGHDDIQIHFLQYGISVLPVFRMVGEQQLEALFPFKAAEPVVIKERVAAAPFLPERNGRTHRIIPFHFRIFQDIFTVTHDGGGSQPPDQKTVGKCYRGIVQQVDACLPDPVIIGIGQQPLVVAETEISRRDGGAVLQKRKNVKGWCQHALRHARQKPASDILHALGRIAVNQIPRNGDQIWLAAGKRCHDPGIRPVVEIGDQRDGDRFCQKGIVCLDPVIRDIQSVVGSVSFHYHTICLKAVQSQEKFDNP